MVSEKLLHFIWRHQYFNKELLTTVEGEPVEIQFPGNHNSNQGPDFLNGRIQLNDSVWIGNIEIHINASDWDAHGHSQDVNYKNIILHVVWNYDKEVTSANKFPTLELQALIPKIMLQRYKMLQEKERFVPCENFLPSLSKLAWVSWKERLCVERLQNISTHIFANLKLSNNHWEEVFWWRLARNFGIRLNSDLFEQAAKTISATVLAKHRNNLLKTEALLFGQTNLLPAEPIDAYTISLKTEFEFLKKMHRLADVKIQPAYLRMRPAGFPTVRIAQLSALIVHSNHLFMQSVETRTIKELKKLLQICASEYWDHHYTFGEVSTRQPKKMGFEMSNNIIINTIVPMVFSYGLYRNETQLKEKAIRWLLEITAEQNQFTRKWSLYNVENENAFDSQALLHLKTAYCTPRRCLECAVGNQLMAAAAEPAHVN
jgi:hypothetical protein